MVLYKKSNDTEKLLVDKCVEPMKLTDGPGPAKILIRATNWLGDGVMMTPALGVVRHCFPQAEIVVAANPLVAQVFSQHPWCDRVLVYDKRGCHKGLSGLLHFIREVRQENFDMALLFQKAFEAALIAFWAGIPVRVGFSTDLRGFLLTHKNSLTDEIKRQHHSRHYLEMLRPFGIQGADFPLQLNLSQTEREEACNIVGLDRWLLLNPGAAYGSAKRWYPDRFAAVGNRLSGELGLGVAVIGGPGEVEIGADIEKQLTCPSVNLVGKTTVRQMMAVIANSELAISNDSGPMHIAAAFDTPTVAVFGPTDHTTTYPWSEQSTVVHSGAECAPCLKRKCPIDHHCMLNVTVDDVVAAALKLLKSD